MEMVKSLVLTLFLVVGLFSQAQSLEVGADIDLICADKSLESLPTRAGGRIKPLRVHAEQTIRLMMGKNKTGLSATQLFCRLSMKALMPVNQKAMLLVEHVDTKKLLDIPDEQKMINLEDISSSISQLQFEYNKTKEDNSAFHKDLSKTLNRANLAKQIVSGQSWTFFDRTVSDWVPLNFYLTPKKLEGYQAQSGQEGHSLILSFLNQSQADYIKVNNDDYLLELTYTKLNIFSWTMVVVLFAIVALTLFKSFVPGVSFSILAIILQLIGITMRVMISGRAPITNMYETVMFSGFGALVIGSIIAGVKKDKLYLFGGLAYNLLCLLMMTFAVGMLDESISPLVPVLRDNFWLSTHVTCIILSYAALALSWMIANIVLAQNFFSRLTPAEYKKKEQIVYNCIKIGSVLLSAGIILGGVWADYSWGRFWGWDPKETWSLIVLLIYMAILHGRFSSWIPKERFVALSAAAFMSVMMAWFGVNYILASGLHSYGFSEGGAIFLGTFFTLQTVFLLVTFRKPLPLNAQ